MVTFVVEAINTVNTGALVVAPQHEEILGVLDFVCQHEADGLDGLFPPVNVVAQEEVVCVPREPCVFEKFDEIGILSVDVA